MTPGTVPPRSVPRCILGLRAGGTHMMPRHPGKTDGREGGSHLRRPQSCPLWAVLLSDPGGRGAGGEGQGTGRGAGHGDPGAPANSSPHLGCFYASHFPADLQMRLVSWPRRALLQTAGLNYRRWMRSLQPSFPAPGACDFFFSLRLKGSVVFYFCFFKPSSLGFLYGPLPQFCSVLWSMKA